MLVGPYCAGVSTTEEYHTFLVTNFNGLANCKNCNIEGNILKGSAATGIILTVAMIGFPFYTAEAIFGIDTTAMGPIIPDFCIKQNRVINNDIRLFDAAPSFDGFGETMIDGLAPYYLDVDTRENYLKLKAPGTLSDVLNEGDEVSNIISVPHSRRDRCTLKIGRNMTNLEKEKMRGSLRNRHGHS
jgi:hypothetical protein